MTDPKKITAGLKKEFKKSSSVIALVLIGSQAREIIYKANPYSDLEAIIIVKDEDVLKTEQALPELINKFGKSTI